MTKRPLVETKIRTEFGDVLDDPSFYDVGAADRDLTYVPGFSDMRRARDLELAAVASGQKPRHEAKLTPLPVNLRWVRRTSPRGAPDGRKQIGSANLGYRLVSKEQIGKQDWLKELPPGSVVETDGSITKGDCVLMVTDGKTAARNVARKHAQTMQMASDSQAAELLSLGAHRQGTDPFARKEA